MESIFKTIFFLLGGIIVLGLIILLLPVLLLIYIFTPKQQTKSWFNTFSRSTRQAEAKDTKKKKTMFFQKVPASEDLIDISADEIKDKK